MGPWNIDANCHVCHKSEAFPIFFLAFSMSTVVKTTLKYGSCLYLLKLNVCSFDLEIDV